MQEGRPASAQDLYRESLALAEQGGEDPGELASRHFDLSLVQKYDGKLEDALGHLKQARTYAERKAKPAQIAVILGQLAEVTSRLGRYDEALGLIEESLALRSALPDPRKALITMGIRVDIHIEMGDTAGAERALQQLEQEAAGIDDPISRAFLMKRTGLVRLLQGREGEGLALLDDACTVFRAQGREHWVADCQETVERLLNRADEAAKAGRQ